MFTKIYYFFQYLLYLFNFFPFFVYKCILNVNQINFIVLNGQLLKYIYFLKYHFNLNYKSLVEISCLDYIDKKNRFELVYNLLSMKWNHRLIIKTWTNEVTNVASLTQIYSSSFWLEREIFDLFGIYFENHSDLRRLLTDYGFEGHPLKKDFPLSGYSEVKYDETNKRIIYEPIQLIQEFRVFEFQNPWEFYSKKIV